MSDHYWLGPDPKFDLCSHGLVTLRAGGVSLLAGEEVCTSAAALRLLRSLRSDAPFEPCSACEQMLPCCGHFLCYDMQGRVLPLGCPNGATFGVRHRTVDGVASVWIDRVEVRLGADRPIDWAPVAVPLAGYAAQVRSFAREVKAFYERSPRRAGPDVSSSEYVDLWREIDEGLGESALPHAGQHG